MTEGKYSDEKLDESWSEDTAGTLTLNKDSITSDDKTVQIDKTTATITEAGTYILTGTLTDGQTIVDAENKGDVKLVLNDADINCSSSAPIYIKSGNTVITLADGTENSVSDGEEYIYEKEDDDEPNAAIFAKDDLTFNGSGSLTVTGNYNHAIQSKDDLKFVAGTFDITSVGDGIVGKDSISVKDGIFTITSAGDGIKSTNIEETDKGYIMIDGGTFQIQSENDAMQAETLLRVNDGTFDILTNGTGQNMTQNSDSAKALKSYVELTVAGGSDMGDRGGGMAGEDQGASLTINGGTLYVNAEGDGLDAEPKRKLYPVSHNANHETARTGRDLHYLEK